MSKGEQHDYVIVGAGAAGCALAARLSERRDVSVLLLEAGRDLPPGREPSDVLDVFPSSYYNGAHFWPDLRARWRNAPEAPPSRFLQARVMGGGGSVMGMVALRGTPADYAEWERLGAQGWGWDGVLPYFRMLECDVDCAGDLHGDRGPLPIRRVARANWPPLANAVAAFAAARGDAFIVDMNADFRDGLGSVPMCNTVQRRGSSAICYLDAGVRARANLSIVTDTQVRRVLFEGRRSIGVEAVVGQVSRQFAAREVVLCAGAIFSPAILLRSGVGDARQLRSLGIEVTADLPGVGTNLQNHPALYVGFQFTTAGRQPRSLRTNPTVAWRFSSGLPNCPPADLLIHVQSKTSWNALGARIGNLTASLARPFSRGAVRLDPEAPHAAPYIEFNCLADDRDLERMTMVFRRVVDIVRAPGVRDLFRTVFPVRFDDRLRLLNGYSRTNAIKTVLYGAVLDVWPALGRWALGRLTDARTDLGALVRDSRALMEHVRENVAGSFHPAGSCRMGANNDPGAVVDPFGRVHGMTGLRVADASIMPILPAANTFLPTVMIAEKIAAGIAAGEPPGTT